MNTGVKVAIGAGVGLLLLRHIGQNILDSKAFERGLRSTDRTEIAQIVAYFRAKGDKVRADVLQARLDNL